MDTYEYVALLTSLIKVAKHHDYKDLTPSYKYLDLTMLDQEATTHNTDESQNPAIEA